MTSITTVANAPLAGVQTSAELAHVPGPMGNAIACLKAGVSVDQLRGLMDLQREWEANESRKAYVADMATFKRNPPTIRKTKQVGYTNKDGTFTGYCHATLGDVAEAVVSSLAACGFSHSWATKQDGGIITVTCKITHSLGHSESTVMQSAPDQSGKKNAIQAVSSAITYMQRYTLLSATGLATVDMEDDDGRSYDDANVYNDGHQEAGAQTAQDDVPAGLPGYSDDEFKKKFEGWKGIVESGRKTPETLIAFLQTRATLSQSQVQQIQNIGA